MKTLILLAITGGLFFSEPGLSTKHAKNNKVYTKKYVKHCVKKCNNSAKKANG
ncbi:hypothetical protein [Mucilaginibacter sp. SG564]|uniref:hypothetical protein n=1 Tax=Mucilaginibacter sp. SG564 TaxID=2587022 RepID=UPI001555A0CE|nr:hypothetical protein [Mucilaginibacter sp. SG564]NOW97387.1 hypothetical protein [Mucilaginibacter sp. SG564]